MCDILLVTNLNGEPKTAAGSCPTLFSAVNKLTAHAHNSGYVMAASGARTN